MVTFTYSENGGTGRKGNTTPEDMAKHFYSLARTKMARRDASPILTINLKGLRKDEFSGILKSLVHEMTKLAKSEELKAITLNDRDFSGKEKIELARLLQIPDSNASGEEFTKRKASTQRIYFQLRKV